MIVINIIDNEHRYASFKFLCLRNLTKKTNPQHDPDDLTLDESSLQVSYTWISNDTEP